MVEKTSLGVRPTFSAFRRSISVKRDGAPELKSVKTPAKVLSLLAAATSPLAALASASGPSPARSSSISLNPPAAPKPWTVGGMITRTLASFTTTSFSRSAFTIVAAFTPGMCRPKSDGRDVNTVPTLGATVEVDTSYPAVGEVCRMPGMPSAISFTWRTTLSVRSRLAPGGN